jgi:uncharacterized protein YggU (UPF0235/DUF167 family)
MPRETADESVTLRVRLTPRGGRNALTRYEDGVLHARVAAAPVDGAANKALLTLLAETLDLSRFNLTLISGATSREKTVLVMGIDPAALEARLSTVGKGSDGT